MILILSNPKDVHARHVASKLRQRGKDVTCIPRAVFGDGASLAFSPVMRRGSILFPDGTRIATDDVSAVWYRRPGPVSCNPAVTDERDRSFTETEWGQALDGFFTTAFRRVVSPPLNQRAATKPVQLCIASRLGLRVPRTLISSDREAAIAFVADHDGAVVHKAMSAPPHAFIDTRVWDSEASHQAEELSICPTILQEHIVGPADVRVTRIGGQMFSACIHTGQGRSKIDSRLDHNVPYTPYELPNDVEALLFRLMDELGLVFGTIDLKLTASGEHVFLEINPQGQFLYVEILAGLPISDALADYLARD